MPESSEDDRCVLGPVLTRLKAIDFDGQGKRNFEQREIFHLDSSPLLFTNFFLLFFFFLCSLQR